MKENAALDVAKMKIIESMDYYQMKGESHMKKLFVYENSESLTPTWTIEGTPRTLYYLYQSLARMYQHRDGGIPYMLCTDKSLNFWILCRRYPNLKLRRYDI